MLPFWPYFGNHLASKSCVFSASICGCLFVSHFSIFHKNGAKIVPQTDSGFSRGAHPGRSWDASGTPPRFFTDFPWILVQFLRILDGFGHLFLYFFAGSPFPKYQTTQPGSPVSFRGAAVSLCDYNDFRPPFWHRIFVFFRKWRKCEISEEYNAKRGSEPSKTSHFRIDFSSNFHVFSEPPSRGHF